MGSGTEHSPTEGTDNPTLTTSRPSTPPMGCRATWHPCIQARHTLLERLDKARNASNEEEARRLEEEAEVLLWKMRRAINPVREVPTAILARFDEYTGHPHLPGPR